MMKKFYIDDTLKTTIGVILVIIMFAVTSWAACKQDPVTNDNEIIIENNN